MPPDLSRPEVRRGHAVDYGPCPHLDPTSLRPGVDVLRVWRKGHDVPINARVLFLGHAKGKAIVALPSTRGGWRVILMDPTALDEADFLVEAWRPDVADFTAGYDVGAFEAIDERPTGTKSQGRRPSYFGRGVAAGASDRLRGIVPPLGSPAPFNHALRSAAARYPLEHFAPYPSRPEVA